MLCTQRIWYHNHNKNPDNHTNKSKKRGWYFQKNNHMRPLSGCCYIPRLQGIRESSLSAFYKSLESGAVLGGNEISTASVCPTDAIRPVILLLHLEEIDGRVQIPGLDLMTSRNEGLERNDLATFLHIQEMVDQFVVELWGERLIVNQDDVGPLQDSDDAFFRKEVAPSKMCFTRREAPEATACFELSLLKIGEIAGVLHHFATPALAADFQSGL